MTRRLGIEPRTRRGSQEPGAWERRARRLEVLRGLSYVSRDLNGSFRTTFTPEIVPVTAFRTRSAALDPTLPAASIAPFAAAEAACSALTPTSRAPRMAP